MTDAAAKRNKSTARRERRDRRHYLAGERAGMLAGLKEAVGLVSNMPRRAGHGGPYEGAAAEIPSADEALAAIRARIAEIEGEDNAASSPNP